MLFNFHTPLFEEFPFPFHSVVIKIVSKRSTNSRYLLSPVESKAVPAEVALMQMVNQPPVWKNIIQLIEWFDEPDRYILVLEHPDPCVDLQHFFNNFQTDRPTTPPHEVLHI
ncbi:hypothetical protein MHYP_G00193300 [Metynnis hypsauchen]